MLKINFVKIMYHFAVTAGKTLLGMHSSEVSSGRSAFVSDSKRLYNKATYRMKKFMGKERKLGLFPYN